MRNFNDLIVDAGRHKNMPKGRRKETQGDWEALPDREPMRRRDCGYLEQRDYLNPLLRWLDAQVGRPWNKVYSDLCKAHPKGTIDRHHTVFQHVDGYVERYPEFRNGVPMSVSSNLFYPVRRLYVDRQGILRNNAKVYKGWGKRNKTVDNYLVKDGNVNIYVTKDGRMFKESSGPIRQNATRYSYLIRDSVGLPFEMIHSDKILPIPWKRDTQVMGPFVAVYETKNKRRR